MQYFPLPSAAPWPAEVDFHGGFDGYGFGLGLTNGGEN
jgi:hypothetical protein